MGQKVAHARNMNKAEQKRISTVPYFSFQHPFSKIVDKGTGKVFEGLPHVMICVR